jgi:hypothetical protein
LGRHGRYLPTVASLTSMPSLSSSPWMRRAPQNGLAGLMWRIDEASPWRGGESDLIAQADQLELQGGAATKPKARTEMTPDATVIMPATVRQCRQNL